MAKELKTGWIRIATSGSVVFGKSDGRVIEKKWLTDSVNNFNLNVFTPQLWPDHQRWFYPVGKVLALKVEDTIEPELAGELHLYAILSPNDSLIEANKRGHYTFPSIEVEENYLGNGTFFLAGLGVVDEPASSGVDQLKFSRIESNEKVFSFPGIQFDTSNNIVQEKTFFDNLPLFNKKSITTYHEDDEAMNEKQFAAMNTNFEKLDKTLGSVASALKNITDSNKEFSKHIASLAADDSVNSDSGLVTSEQFKTLTEKIESANKVNQDLADNFEKIQKEFSTLRNQEIVNDDDGDDGSGGEGVVTAL